MKMGRAEDSCEGREANKFEEGNISRSKISIGKMKEKDTLLGRRSLRKENNKIQAMLGIIDLFVTFTLVGTYV